MTSTPASGHLVKSTQLASSAGLRHEYLCHCLTTSNLADRTAVRWNIDDKRQLTKDIDCRDPPSFEFMANWKWLQRENAFQRTDSRRQIIYWLGTVKIYLLFARCKASRICSVSCSFHILKCRESHDTLHLQRTWRDSYYLLINIYHVAVVYCDGQCAGLVDAVYLQEWDNMDSLPTISYAWLNARHSRGWGYC